MTNRKHIPEAIWNGIRSLTDEAIQGRGLPEILAGRNAETAQRRGNERAEKFWREVRSACDRA